MFHMISQLVYVEPLSRSNAVSSKIADDGIFFKTRRTTNKPDEDVVTYVKSLVRSNAVSSKIADDGIFFKTRRTANKPDEDVVTYVKSLVRSNAVLRKITKSDAEASVYAYYLPRNK